MRRDKIEKPNFKGIRKRCDKCRDLWPHFNVGANGLCPKCNTT